MVTAAELVRQSARITALTGAGISAESGIPTFRDNNGLWRNFRAEDLATPQAFARDPKIVWEWYNWRRSLIAKAEPNPGHYALVTLEQAKPGFTLITQNVDGLHARAGSRDPLLLHGDIWTLRCTGCGDSKQDHTPDLKTLPPVCRCGAIRRPGVVWFGEGLPQDIWRRAEQAVRGADLLLVVGTSAQVYPAAGLIHLAQSSGAKVIEINAAETPVSGTVDFSLRGPSGRILPELIERDKGDSL
ncbi:MAG: NAD-dependent deacylase [Acidobacteria bacterium]|nr:NAD-dependent deacylase [Acidobacteriota bacterium]